MRMKLQGDERGAGRHDANTQGSKVLCQTSKAFLVAYKFLPQNIPLKYTLESVAATEQ